MRAKFELEVHIRSEAHVCSELCLNNFALHMINK